MRLKDGSIFDRYSAPLNDPDGAYYGRVWYYRDITQQRELEEKKEYYGRAQSLLAEISRDFILSNSDNIDEKIDRMLAKTAEFVVLLPSTEHTVAGRISDRILEAVNDLKVQGRPISVACGYATKEKAGQSFNTVFKKADKQMYRSKMEQKKYTENRVVNPGC